MMNQANNRNDIPQLSVARLLSCISIFLLFTATACEQRLPNNTDRPIAGGLVAPQPQETPPGTVPIEHSGGHFPSELKTPQPIRSILFIGNSHTSGHGLPQMIKDMLESSGISSKVEIEIAGGGFLSEHLKNPLTQEKLNRQPWDVVVLQAQQYSQSGKYSHLYPIDPAVEWVKRVKDQGGLPVMYPEWAQLRGGDEGMDTYLLHRSIAEREAARVAPIGQAWYRAMHQDPALTLHSGDGNHASLWGAYLTACTLFATISEESPLKVPYLPQIKIPEATQKQLQKIAFETLRDVVSFEDVVK